MRPYRHNADIGGMRSWLRAVLRAVGGFAMVASLSGCLLDADKPDIAIDVPQSYRNTSGDADAALPALDWWQGFRSAELTSLMQEAQAANLDVAVAVAQILQADAQVRIAGAPLLPLINFNGSDTGSKVSQQLGTGGGGGSSGSSSRGGGSSSSSSSSGGSPFSRLYATSLSASYIVDFWGKNQAALKAAVETSTASRYNREVVALTAVTAVADTYFAVLEAQDRLRIARRNLTDATRILDLIKQQFAAGTSSDLNVAQQESLVEQVRAVIPLYEETRLQNIAALTVLVGRTPERFTMRGSSLNKITVPRVTPGLPSSVLLQRPDVRQAEMQLRSSTYSIESARAAFFPTIQLTGQLGYQSAALKLLFGPGAWAYTAAASLTQPLFDGGVLLGQLELQKGLQDQYLQAYRKSILSAFSNVEQSLVAVQQTTEAERIQERVVSSSRRAFDLSEQQLKAGTLNLVTLLQTEETLFTAEDALAVDRYNRLLGVVGLFQALGGGWPPAGTDEPRPRDPFATFWSPLQD
jgi:NodT family efflux transporter outer membrane factor (OMF) lipoprotein